ILKWDAPPAPASRLPCCRAPERPRRLRRWPMRCCLRSSSCLPFWLTSQLTPEDLADIRFRQAVAELHIFRPLVAGEVLAGEIQQFLAGHRRIAAHHEELRHL